MTILLKCLLFIGILSTAFTYELPKSWFIAGNQPKKYDMGIDKGAGYQSKNAATIKSIDQNIDGFGTLMQECSVANYSGKRVRITGYIKSKDVTDGASLWFRVDQIDSATAPADSLIRRTVSFDNMQDRAIKGTTDWKKYEIVLEVPAGASFFAYGVLLAGTGQVWFDNITFEAVGTSVPVTKPLIGDEPWAKSTEARNQFHNSALAQPANLNFEE